jgi:small subunit ribosomal protein S21
MRKQKHQKKCNQQAVKGGDTTSRESSTPFSDAVQATPLETKVYSNNFDRALKTFRAMVQKERILSQYKEKQTYEKPSDKRRRKRNDANRKTRNEQREENTEHQFDKNAE